MAGRGKFIGLVNATICLLTQRNAGAGGGVVVYRYPIVSGPDETLMSITYNFINTFSSRLLQLWMFNLCSHTNSVGYEIFRTNEFCTS
jgi:hypothetical protein